MRIPAKSSVTTLVGIGVLVAMLFGPAGTFDYWQGWLFLAVFTLATGVPDIYLMRTNPAALERRLHAGPWAEPRPVQKLIIAAVFSSSIATIMFSPLDHRFGWSPVPTALTVLGDVLVAVGLSAAMLVVIQNGYVAANVTVEADQPLVSTGLYGLVRHPMYTGSLIMMIGTPLALDSYWGLVCILPGMIALIFRIRDEEKALTEELAGYRGYTQRVRYRLLPYVW